MYPRGSRFLSFTHLGSHWLTPAKAGRKLTSKPEQVLSSASQGSGGPLFGNATERPAKRLRFSSQSGVDGNKLAPALQPRTRSCRISRFAKVYALQAGKERVQDNERRRRSRSGACSSWSRGVLLASIWLVSCARESVAPPQISRSISFVARFSP